MTGLRWSLSVSAAAMTYFALTFAAGFCLGVVRVLVLQPRFGEIGAVVCELPVILAMSWVICGWVIDSFDVPSTLAAHMVMGGGALTLLLLLEAVLSVLVFDRTLVGHIQQYQQMPAQLGLAAQLAFSSMPYLRVLLRR